MTRPTRRVRRLALLALVAAATLVLAACNPQEAGSAAVVGSSRVTETQIDADARTAAELIEAQGGAVPATADLLRAQIEFQVDQRLVDAAAAKEGITVTQGQVDELIASSGGRDQVEKQLVVQDSLWLPPANVDGLARSFLIQQALGEKLAPGAADADKTQAVNKYLADLALSMGVSISPRYGTWDTTTQRIQPGFDELSRPAVSPSAEPSASPSGAPSAEPSASPSS